MYSVVIFIIDVIFYYILYTLLQVENIEQLANNKILIFGLFILFSLFSYPMATFVVKINKFRKVKILL